VTKVGLGSFFSFEARIALPFDSATFFRRRSTLCALASLRKPSMMQLAV